MHELRVAADDLDEPPERPVMEAWFAEAEALLDKLRHRDSERTKKKAGSSRKIERVAGQHLLHALDNGLLTATGAGLARFFHAEDDPLRALSIEDLSKREDLLARHHPLLMVAMDQGAEGCRP